MKDTLDDNARPGAEDTIAAEPIDPAVDSLETTQPKEPIQEIQEIREIEEVEEVEEVPEALALPVVERSHYQLGDVIVNRAGRRVVRARDRLGRTVVIKEATSGDADADVERELRLTARLQHPSITVLHEAGRWAGGGPFLAMKQVTGRPLDRLIGEAKTPDERLALLPRAIAIADALAYAHAEGIVHRVIEPANVLCADHGETVIIDWAIAKELATSDFDLESTVRSRSGSARAAFHAPAYMAPEQAKGIPVNARADVYAIGALLYHMLSGIPPYQGRDVDATVAAIAAGPPPSLRIRAPHVQFELVKIVEKAMARDPQQRYASAKQMVDDLRRFEAAQLVAIPSGSLGDLIVQTVRRNRKAVAILAGVVLLVLIVALVRCGET